MMRTPEFKVGLFVLVCLAIVAAMSFQVNNDPSVTGKARHYEAVLPDASGLVKNSNVKTAGISVGIIRDIILENGKARIVMNVRGDLPVTTDASVEVKPNGILGDKTLELLPGDPNAPLLADGGRITKIVDKGSMDAVLNQVGRIASDVSKITENLKNATSGEGDDNSPIGRILHNIEDVTADLREISDNKKDKLEATIDNIHNLSSALNEFINDDSDEGFKNNWKKMAKSLGRVDDILRNVDEVTAKINGGKGTLGKLINDEQTVEELNHAIAGVNNMLDTASKFQINIDYHEEFLGGGNFVKSYIGLNIQPGPDRYYLVQLIDDPKGVYNHSDNLNTVNGTPTLTDSQNVYHNQLKLSAEFAKTFHNLTLRAGVIENAGGVGVDYTFLRNKLKVSAEAFNWGRPEGVDVRAYAKYKFYSVFYAIFGGDDILNKGNNSFSGTAAAGFVGAGIDFTNDDIKLLLSKVPF